MTSNPFVDECYWMESACSKNATCTNLRGLYRCDCKEGFVDQFGDASSCLDVAECYHGAPCSENSECENTIGDYRNYIN